MKSNKVNLRFITYGLSLVLLASCGSGPANSSIKNSPPVPAVITPTVPEVTLPITLPATTPYNLPEPNMILPNLKISVNYQSV